MLAARAHVCEREKKYIGECTRNLIKMIYNLIQMNGNGKLAKNSSLAGDEDGR